jgi:hypothetical protein
MNMHRMTGAEEMADPSALSEQSDRAYFLLKCGDISLAKGLCCAFERCFVFR